MKFSQSKFDHISTNSSQYFKTTSRGSDTKLEKCLRLVNPIKSENSEIQSPKLSKIMTNYATPQTNQLRNSGKDVLRLKPYLQTKKKQPVSIINGLTQQTYSKKSKLGTHSKRITNHIQQNKYDKIQTGRETYGLGLPDSVDSRYNQINLDLQNTNRYGQQRNEYQDKIMRQKENIKPQNDAQRQSYSQYFHGPKINRHELSYTEESNEPHKLLQHIHFSIKHQNLILEKYKTHAQNQKNKIQSQLDNSLKEIQNTMYQVRSKVFTIIDDNYHQVIRQMTRLKQLAEIMWQKKAQNSNYQTQRTPIKSTNKNTFMNSNKSVGKGNDFSVFHGSHAILNNKININPNVPSSQSIKRSHSSSLSKHTIYSKFSETNPPSAPTNIRLLEELQQQDKRLQHFLQTKMQYFGTQADRQNSDCHYGYEGDESTGYHVEKEVKKNNNKSVDKQKLLREMYESSYHIAALIKQNCEYFIGEEVSKVNISEKQLFFDWVNVNSFANKNNQSYSNHQYISEAYQTIEELKKEQVLLLTEMFNDFKSCLVERYIDVNRNC